MLYWNQIEAFKIANGRDVEPKQMLYWNEEIFSPLKIPIFPVEPKQMLYWNEQI